MWQSALCYAGSSLVLHSKMQCRRFHYAMLNILCAKFQSALCYVASTMRQSALYHAGPSSVLHSKMQSSMPLDPAVDPLNTIINTVHTT